MRKIIGIGLLLFLMQSIAFAEKLDITVNQAKISLPYWKANTTQYGAVLIVKGGPPQWSTLLAQFAKRLKHTGWSVALLNCNPGNATPWVDQIPEAISALRQDKNNRIVLVHYGDQLNQSLAYFSKPQAKMINGLIMLSAYDDQSNLDPKQSVRFPLYDIAGQFDYDNVLRQMKNRTRVFKQPEYKAIEMPGAQHDYEYSQAMVLSFMHGWMSKLPEIKPQPAPILSSYIEPVFPANNYIASLPTFTVTN